MNYKVTPWKHQLQAIELAKDRDFFALFFEQGCGKTSALINILRHKYQAVGNKSTLILCPQIVIENWRREILQHSEIPDSDIICLTGTGFRRLCDFENKVLVKPNRIVITNYEALYMKPLLAKLLEWAPWALVLDESHKCKDISSIRTRMAVKLSKTATIRFLLSGTPIVNSLFDIYSQFLILDGGVTFGEKFNHFREDYFIDENAGRARQFYFPDWQPREGAYQEVNSKIAPHAMRVEKKDCLDLPPFVRQTVEVSLGPDQQKAYREMFRDAVAELPTGDLVTADLAIKKALRLQQIVTGYVGGDDGNNFSFEKNPRLNALQELVEQISKDHQIIIWAVFKQNYHDITDMLRRLRITYVEVHGSVSAQDKQRAVDRFNSGSARVLVGHPISGGIGVNLVAASYAIFYSRGFSLEADLQAEARNYRGGSERHEKVTRIDIVAPNTIDEVVLAALTKKQDVSNAIINFFNKQKDRR